MVDSEKMGEEERDKKIIQFFRAVFQTYDSDDAGELFPQMKSINKWVLTNPLRIISPNINVDQIKKK